MFSRRPTALVMIKDVPTERVAGTDHTDQHLHSCSTYREPRPHQRKMFIPYTRQKLWRCRESSIENEQNLVGVHEITPRCLTQIADAGAPDHLRKRMGHSFSAVIGWKDKFGSRVDVFFPDAIIHVIRRTK